MSQDEFDPGRLLDTQMAVSSEAIERDLALVRDSYRSLDRNERRELKRYLDVIAGLKLFKTCKPRLYVTPRVSVVVPSDESESVVVPAATIRRAIAAWDKGMNYTCGWGDVDPTIGD